ncbi:MAG: cupredoxin family copper-binding protein [Candidatus ainarchaeum sp.]|nr:cupredoxin family copper-binding protein [Candidatus ainarchaeum sp.]
MKTGLLLICFVVFAVLFSGCTQQPAQAPLGGNNSNTIEISNFSFSPSEITIKKGETVAWINKDSAKHSIVSDSGSELNSTLLATNETFSHTFNSSGTFGYHCTVHASMKGKVIVE